MIEFFDVYGHRMGGVAGMLFGVGGDREDFFAGPLNFIARVEDVDVPLVPLDLFGPAGIDADDAAVRDR